VAVDVLFSDAFVSAVQSLVERHHTIYPRLPPQGLFFESLVEQAFLSAGRARAEIVPTTPNSPWHDLSVSGIRLSIKSETGKATRPAKISITKLCTTETGEWSAAALVAHTIAHVRRHDRMLMIRAIWRRSGFDYQLLEIPIELLARLETAEFVEVGQRAGRRSLGANIIEDGETIFRVHFDGADGKCQVHGLLVSRCRMLREWHQPYEV
jgi:type II restriction enzyme